MHVSTQKAHGAADPMGRPFDTVGFKVLLILFAAALNGVAWMFITTLLCALFGAVGSTLPFTVGLIAAALSAVALLAISAMQRGRGMDRSLD